MKRKTLLFKYWKYGALIILSALFCFPVQSQAQIVVTGTVKDSVNAEPMPGVNIILKGTTSGTTTDKNGRYSISGSG